MSAISVLGGLFHRLGLGHTGHWPTPSVTTQCVQATANPINGSEPSREAISPICALKPATSVERWFACFNEEPNLSLGDAQ